MWRVKLVKVEKKYDDRSYKLAGAYILLRRIRIRPALRGRIRIGIKPDRGPQYCL
jgi:hypothetical protein